jgi:hypothetical protein
VIISRVASFRRKCLWNFNSNYDLGNTNAMPSPYPHTDVQAQPLTPGRHSINIFQPKLSKLGDVQNLISL